jgi:hypothetical protein
MSFLFKVLSEWHAKHNLLSSGDTPLAALTYKGKIIKEINKKTDMNFFVPIQPPMSFVRFFDRFMNVEVIAYLKNRMQVLIARKVFIA